MNSGTEHKRSVREAFNRAAASYDRAASVQREVCLRLMGFAASQAPSAPAGRILDAGCGTGYGVNLLAERFPSATLLALDFAPAMLARLAPLSGGRAPRFAVCGDLEALPLADGSVDLVWSSLALQWCAPKEALGAMHRVLRPGGSAWLATLGPQTLHELREAFAPIDEAEHVIRFRAPEYWLDEARRAGFAVLAHEAWTTFALAPDLRGLLRDIKAIGAHSVGPERRRQPLGRAAWRALEAHYERHRREDGLLPATYDVILIALQKVNDRDE